MDIADIAAQATTEVVDMFSGLINTDELKARVKDITPLRDDDFKIVEVKGSSKQFKATINCNINDEAGTAMFIENYNAKNGETLRVASTFRKTKFKSVKYFRCHHNTRYHFYIYLSF